METNKSGTYRALTAANIAASPVWQRMAAEQQEAVLVVSRVLPFRTNEYLVNTLIDWGKIPDDPIYQLTFPQREMLAPADYETIRRLLRRGAPEAQLDVEVNRIRMAMNPHPGGQIEYNVPRLDGRPLPGLQQKYRETVLFFPSQGQTCHAYCTYCFRWAQFVNLPELKFSTAESRDLLQYLACHPNVKDLLITGGDPLIMKADLLRRYIEPVLAPEFDHVQTIRIGTKAVAYWPQRFVTDPDADSLLRLFADVVTAGRHLAVIGHYSHPREMSTEIARAAIRRIRSTGAEIRIQSPLVRHVNDSAAVWRDLCDEGVRQGLSPYYMFVERDTGPRNYFEVPLVRAYEIFVNAFRSLSGLARTLRGPVMSTTPGKVRVLGVRSLQGRQVIVLDFLQARVPERVGRPFFAAYHSQATWFDQLQPAFEEDRHFFSPESVCENGPMQVDDEASIAPATAGGK